MSTETFETALAPELPQPAQMSPRTRACLHVLGAAAVAGVAADALLREAPWGLNLLLFALVFCELAVALDRWAGTERARPWWTVPVVALAALAAWRDSPTLKGLDLLALGLVLALAAFQLQGGAVRRSGVGVYLAAGLAAYIEIMLGGISVLAGIRWNELPRRGWSRHAPAVVRGVVIAGPVLVVFGGLLVAADAGFEKLVNGMLRFDGRPVFLHVFMSTLFAWAATGIYRSLYLAEKPIAASFPPRPGALTLGATEVGIVLGVLNVLFLAFVAVQVRWLFGGAAVVASTAKLGYADYARRGFFELSAVAGLVLPMLLVLHWMLRDGRAEARLFRVLAGVQVALLYVIMASATWHMWMYLQAYGLTELRVYTSAFMVWLAGVFAWFALTVLREMRERFAWGAVVSGLCTVAVLHAVSPDALIMRANTTRPNVATEFDAAYATRLSGDGVPVLLAAIPRLGPDARCTVATNLLREWVPAAGESWRAWSWGRSRAASAVAAQRAELKAVCPAAAAADAPPAHRAGGEEEGPAPYP